MLNQQYKQFVRVKSALIVYSIVCAGIALMIIAGGLASPHHTIVIEDGGQIGPPAIPLITLFLIAAFPAAIFATVLGAGLAAETAHTLSWAWTRPISRARYASGQFLVDVIGITVAFIIGLLVLELLPLAAFGFTKNIVPGASDFAAFVRALAFPLAVYGLLQALTASLKRNAGLVLGLAWPIGSIFAGFKDVDLAHPFRDVVAAVNMLNPWHYLTFHFNSHDFHPASPDVVASMITNGIALVLLAVLGVIAATVQWNRLEA